MEMAKSGEKFERPTPQLLNLSWRGKIQLNLIAVFVCDHFKSLHNITFFTWTDACAHFLEFLCMVEQVVAYALIEYASSLSPYSHKPPSKPSGILVRLLLELPVLILKELGHSRVFQSYFRQWKLWKIVNKPLSRDKNKTRDILKSMMQYCWIKTRFNVVYKIKTAKWTTKHDFITCCILIFWGFLLFHLFLLADLFCKHLVSFTFGLIFIQEYCIMYFVIVIVRKSNFCLFSFLSCEKMIFPHKFCWQKRNWLQFM